MCGAGNCSCAMAARRGSGLVHCPVHSDPGPSLNVSEKDGKVLVHCHATCEQRDVIQALRDKGVWPDEPVGQTVAPRPAVRTGTSVTPPVPVHVEPPPKPLGKFVGYYEYCEAGKAVFRVARYEPKNFRQLKPNGKGGWTWGLEGITPILYRLDELRAAVKSKQRVYVVEGERDADSGAAIGLATTTSPMGAGKWRDHYSQEFVGADVVVVEDKDEPNQHGKRPGTEHARTTAESIDMVARCVRILRLPGDDVKDLSDWLKANPENNADRLNELADEQPELRSPTSIHLLTTSDRATRYWDILDGRMRGDPDYVGWQTGLTFLKDVAAYFPQDLWLIAAPTGTGKTSMLLTLQRSLDEREVPIPSLFATLEQPWEQLMDRDIAAMGEIDGYRLRTGRDLDMDTMAKISKALGRFIKRPSIMLDEASLTTERLEQYVRVAKIKHGVKVVFVDYVQRIGDKNESEYLRVSRISNALARIARDYKVCIVSAAQGNRRGAVGSQGDDPNIAPRPPELSDMRDSGYLEQDSAVVLALGRREGSREAVLAVRKNRHGPSGVTKDLIFDAPHMRFLERAEE